MPTLLARDGTTLAYEAAGEGPPLVCLPGGPMLDAGYLGDLGGLSGSARLILADPRGAGRSQAPADLASCRCDRMVDDVEALREHLGLERLDLLGHSAGANLAVTYATRHPGRIRKLALITPSTIAVGITATAEDRRDVVRRRVGEPEHEQVSTAFEAIAAGHATDEARVAIAPFTYGRWDAAAQAHFAVMEERRDDELALAHVADGAFDPPAVRAALATFEPPVLVLAGDVDLAGPQPVIAEMATLFPNAVFRTQPGAGHFPWLDDAATFRETVADFLA